ncbi:MAG: T9SS type A sorting domain-containing protein [Bacteroidales bacterium]|nr:T9SS type A sorting domain-containing protein [Bacteroidales bacterium]
MSRYRKLYFLVCLMALISGAAFSQDDEIKILPLGNSLTYGYYNGTVLDGNRIGYRKKLYDLLNASGYNFDFVGHQYTGNFLFPDAENGGTLGIHDEELADVMSYGYYLNDGWDKVDVVYPNQPYLNVYPADIILLHIGTNDWINDEYYLHQVDDLHELFDAVDDYETSHNTEVLVIVAKIINAKNSFGDCSGNLTDWRVTFYNQQLTTVVNERIAAGDKVKLIDMQCGAGIDYYSDMLNLNHPNQTGYDKMGQHWFNEIDNIHTAPVITSFSFDDAGQGESFPQIDLDNHVSDDYTVDANIEWTLETTPANYNVSIDVNHVLTVTPKSSSWIGSEAITFVATDKGRYIEKLHKSASITVTFNTIDINEQPVILSQLTSFNLNEDEGFVISLTDLEIEDDDPSTNWTLNVKAGDHYSYSGTTITPEQDWDEQILVNVTVSDLEEESEVFQVLATYNPVPDAPVINSVGPFTISEDNSRTITLSDIGYTDPDSEAGDLTITLLAGSNYTVNGTTITPDANYFGALSVGVRLQDLTLYSNTVYASINVTAVNDAPEITSVPDTLIGDGSNDFYEYQIIAYDVDTEDVLDYTVLAKPAWLTFSESGLLSGSPVGHLGNHPISLGVSDGTVTTLQSFNLKVEHFNTAPAFTSIPDSVVMPGEDYNWKVKAEDIDGDAITFIGLDIPDFLNFLSLNAYLIGNPTENNMGVYPIVIGATDGQDTTILSFQMYITYDAILTVQAEGLMKVFPNPANATLNIELLQERQMESLRILSVMGHIVHEEKDINLRSGTYSLDISHLPEGTYLLQVGFGDALSYQKILIGR